MPLLVAKVENLSLNITLALVSSAFLFVIHPFVYFLSNKIMKKLGQNGQL
ncbi:hypothetical protein RV15_GL001770 [Enterococcus silesiacus]|uniref:Uncharacterized protein n=1 Tax=Enterococcus silesiacus TaxID=332949 RepID=A0AA91JN71_9ENTE|nr:hypothetical protein RV15_GL001770 [Enterococcus silesiacus]